MTSGVSLPPVDKVREAHRRLEAVVAELSDADLRAPSALPGWTRGHVIAHLADNARAVARQLDTAREGKLVDLYDGGPEGRDAVIASNATLRAGVLQAVLAQRNAELDEAMSDYGDEDWGRRVRYLGGRAAAVVWARWREVEIHLVDMSVGASADEWDEPLATHLLDFLRGRVPAEVTMAATDVAREWPGAGPAW